MKVQVKKTASVIEHYGKKTFSFAGLTGERMKDGTVVFDENSKRKIPKGYIRQGEKEGYDPYAYVFDMDDLEII